MMQSKALSDLLHKLYCASTVPELWSEFLRDLSLHLKLTGASVIHHDLKQGRYSAEFCWGNEEWKPGYQGYYGPLDMWRPRFMERPAGHFSLGKDLCPAREARKTEFYNDHARRCDLDLLGAVATVKHATRLETVNLYQSWKGPHPDPSVVTTMEILFPHLKMALELRRKFLELSTYAHSLERAIDLCEAAIILLDHRGRIVRLNRSAESLLSARNGLSLSNGSICAAASADRVSLNRLIARTVSGARQSEASPGGSIFITRGRRRPLAVTVAPLVASTRLLHPAAAVVLFVYDPESPARPPLDLLRQGYGLTAAEASVAMRLVEGKSLRHVAADRGVTYHTVRHQLKSIFVKTGTRQQTELIRLLMRSFLSNPSHRP